jgi:hypothetical protein
MPSIAALTIYAFGFTAIHHGLDILIRPSQALASKQLTKTAVQPLNAFAVAALGIGIYYVLAAWQENRTFFAATLLRFVSAAIFWKQGDAWKGIARWEGASAVTTAVALAWEGFA